MKKVESEWHRLYQPQPRGDQGAVSEECPLIDASGQVRAMVLELARPADWAALATVWHGVRVDLELPAPAIAVNGKDGYQLWFSVSEPVPVLQATVFLESLCARYLGDIKAQRIGLMPIDDASSPQARHADRVPAEQGQSGRWSAFVAPDLAPVFADEPWLDIPPNFDGQADLLSRLESIQPADFQQAMDRLRPTMTHGHARPGAEREKPARESDRGMNVRSTPTATDLHPKRFLLDVMNDDTVALGLRIEAAKALLPYVDDSGGNAPREATGGRS